MCAMDPPLVIFLKCFQTATSRAPEGPPLLSRPPGDPGLRTTQQLKGSYLIPQGVARSQPQAEDSASSNGPLPALTLKWHRTNLAMG